MQRFVERAQIVLQCLRFARDLPEPENPGVLHAIRNRLAELLLCRLAEAWQLRDAIGFTRLLELRNRANVQLLIKRLDLLRAQPREREKLENIEGKFPPECFEERG